MKVTQHSVNRNAIMSHQERHKYEENKPRGFYKQPVEAAQLLSKTNILPLHHNHYAQIA